MILAVEAPGVFTIGPGTMADYHALARFHYRRARPATWAAILAIRYCESASLSGSSFIPPPSSLLCAVGVLSYPALASAARDLALGLIGMSAGDKARFINENIRTISRVIVHPRFRSLGLATLLARELCRISPTRYVEAFARLGHVHALFRQAGMRELVPESAAKPVYYLFDKEDRNRGSVSS